MKNKNKENDAQQPETMSLFWTKTFDVFKAFEIPLVFVYLLTKIDLVAFVKKGIEENV